MLRMALIFAAGWFTSSALAVPTTIDRSIAKQPDYQSKSPKYLLLVFGAEGKDRAWLVLDGDALYVDRNGNGDLTEAGKRVTAEKKPKGSSDDQGHTFEVGTLNIGGQTHKSVTVITTPVKAYAEGSMRSRPEIKAAMVKNPMTPLAVIIADVAVPGIKGGGIEGRVTFNAGPIDLNGTLFFADAPADAPVVHLGGPLQVTFYAELPTMRVGRKSEIVLVVGTPGQGPGAFSMIKYEGTIPEAAKPTVQVEYTTEKPGGPPLKELYEIKDRC